MKFPTVRRAVLACAFAASAVSPAGAVDLDILTPRQLKEMKDMKSRPLPSWVFAPGCTLYEHPNGGGKSWRFRINSKITLLDGKEYDIGNRNLPPDALGRVSSGKCDWEDGKRTCKAGLYLKPNQEGALKVLGGKILNLDANYNDKVASISVICSTDFPKY